MKRFFSFPNPVNDAAARSVAIGVVAISVTALLTNWEKFLPGPPKRFAQAMGATFSVAATSLWLFDSWSDARWLLLPLIFAASLEGFFGYCVGCVIFSRLMRWGIIPESVCEECANITNRATVSTNSEP